VEGHSTGPSASIAEREAGQLFLEALLVRRLRRARQPVGQVEKPSSLPLLSFETGFDKFRNDSARAGLSHLRQGPYATRGAWRKADALSEWG
jgi:hypothetical protein